MIKVRFEDVLEGTSLPEEEYEWIQLTYDELRCAPDGETIASCVDGLWIDNYGREWTDIFIS